MQNTDQVRVGAPTWRRGDAPLRLVRIIQYAMRNKKMYSSVYIQEARQYLPGERNLIARKLIFGFATISLAFALAACATVPLTPDTLPTFAPIAPQVAPTATDMPTTLPTPAPLADTS